MLSNIINYHFMNTQHIPKDKQTKPALYLTAKEAYELWRAEPEKIKIIDVRTPEKMIPAGVTVKV